MCEGYFTSSPQSSEDFIKQVTFSVFRYLIFQIQILWISTSVSTLCLKIRITQFCIRLLLRAQSHCTGVLMSYLFFFLFSFIHLFSNGLMSYSLSYILCSIHTTLLAISPCLEACFYLKAFILIAATLEHPSPNIHGYSIESY